MQWSWSPSQESDGSLMVWRCIHIYIEESMYVSMVVTSCIFIGNSPVSIMADFSSSSFFFFFFFAFVYLNTVLALLLNATWMNHNDFFKMSPMSWYCVCSCIWNSNSGNPSLTIGVSIVGISVSTGRGMRESSGVLGMFSLYLGRFHMGLYICKILSSSALNVSVLNCL